MARNDIVLLDGILDQRVLDGLPSHQNDEVFEYLAFEQVLKNYDLSREEIESDGSTAATTVEWTDSSQS